MFSSFKQKFVLWVGWYIKSYISFNQATDGIKFEPKSFLCLLMSLAGESEVLLLSCLDAMFLLDDVVEIEEVS